VPVPLGVDIAPQWLSAEEKAAAARRPEPVLDIGLKADSSDAVPTAEPQRRPTPSGSTGVVWSETGTSTGPPESGSESGGRGASGSGRARRSAGAPTSDVDESDLFDDDPDDDLLADIKAGARQSKYAPKARVRRERKEPRDSSLAEARSRQLEYERHREAIQKPTRSRTAFWDWMVAVGALLMLGAVVCFLASFAKDHVFMASAVWRRMPEYSAYVFIVGAYLVFKGMFQG
jgi:hypothetical protein